MKTKLSTLALAALLFAGLPLASSSAYVGVSVAIAPPAIPVYEQPFCPGPGYIWTPGYWDYADFGYYWVPGVWVRPPSVGFLWTPGYWGYQNGLYVFNNGYWGTNVGFYGGINYGYGYGGHGYYGGRWNGNQFLYNTAVTRVNTTVINNNYTYTNKVQPTGSRAGFNGPGGAKAQATAQELAVAKSNHIPPVAAQQERVKAAKNDPALRVANNKGKPKPEAVAALDRKNRANNPNNAENADANNNNRNGRGDQNAKGRKDNAGNNQANARNGRQDRNRNENNKAPRATTADTGRTKAARTERNAQPAKAHSAARTAHTSNRTHQVAQPQRRHETRPVANASHAKRPPTAHQQRPQAAKQQAPANRGPANAPKQGKKKKHNQQGPGQ